MAREEFNVDVTTTNATPTTVTLKSIPVSSAMLVDVYVACRSSATASTLHLQIGVGRGATGAAKLLHADKQALQRAAWGAWWDVSLSINNNNELVLTLMGQKNTTIAWSVNGFAIVVLL